jgi:hypothetical protein
MQALFSFDWDNESWENSHAQRSSLILVGQEFSYVLMYGMQAYQSEDIND